MIENIYTQNLKDLFQTANVYYKNKQYEEAEKLYLLILNKDKNNVNVYYNLGNTYFHLKQFPQSILYYEKAKKLQPDNAHILHNIEHTNNKIFNKIEFSKEFFVSKKIKGFAHTKSSTSWSIYLIVAFWLTSILLAIYFFLNKKWAFKLGLFCCFTSIVFAYFTYTTYKSEYRNDFAILMQSNSYLHKSPVEQSISSVLIIAGTKVQILDTDKNWCKIKLPNDKIGWIQIATLKFI
ncbi:MAG TPA: tetratricopeptide repeat protein [Chitinophagales bacterium]|nr:tetratricopeptide repeat protein [Chitinophagales bacterium]